MTQIDESDPLVAAIAWVLTSLLASRLAEDSPWRRALPTVAVLAAVAGRATVDAVDGQPLGWSTVLRGIGAGAVAVLSHSQMREAQKAARPPQGG